MQDYQKPLFAVLLGLFQIPSSYEECVSVDELIPKKEASGRSPASAQGKIESTAERALDRILDGWLSRI